MPPTTYKAGTFHSCCVRYLIEEKYQPPNYELQRDSPAPDIVCIKDSLRWYINSSTGLDRISKNKKPTVRSTCVFAERFFGGFEDATTSQSIQEDQTEIYTICVFSFCKYALVNTASVD